VVERVRSGRIGDSSVVVGHDRSSGRRPILAATRDGAKKKGPSDEWAGSAGLSRDAEGTRKGGSRKWWDDLNGSRLRIEVLLWVAKFACQVAGGSLGWSFLASAPPPSLWGLVTGIA
jgi:hypothetical protein